MAVDSGLVADSVGMVDATAWLWVRAAERDRRFWLITAARAATA
jgi:hypothetical protein